METDKGKYQNENIRKLLQIAKESSDTEEFKKRVFNFLDKIGVNCPTSGCSHYLTEETFVCLGYDTNHLLLSLVGNRIETKQESAKPLVVDEFCVAQGDEGYCKYCHPGGDEYFSREDAFGKILFCEECGFFIDLEKKQIGYTEDWTL